MGPSVKFVLCINGSFSKKKIRSHFLFGKKDQTGVKGGLAKDHTFYLIFLATFPYLNKKSFVKWLFC